jgi:hypothetical protein
MSLDLHREAQAGDGARYGLKWRGSLGPILGNHSLTTIIDHIQRQLPNRNLVDRHRPKHKRERHPCLSALPFE